MRENFQYIKEIIFLIGESKKGLFAMVLSFLALSVLDIVSISLIIPYISLIISPEFFFNNETVKVLLVITNLQHQSNDIIIYISMLLVTIFLIKGLVGILINRSILKYCFTIGAMMRIKLMSAYQKLPYEEYLQRNSSEYVYSIEHLSAQFSQTVLQSFLRVISESMVVIAILIFLAFNSILAFGVLVILFGFAMFIYDYFFKHKVKGFGKNINKQSTKIVKGVHEGIEGLKEIRVLGKESFFLRIVSKGAISFKKSSVDAQTISQAPRYILEILLITFVALFVLIMDSESEAELLVPILGLFGVAAIRIAPSVNQIISSISHIRFGRDGVSLLYKDVKKIKLSNNLNDSSEFTSNFVHEDFSSLKIKNVSFKYKDDSRYALKNISLDIKAGDTVGIVGPSGSGKTTLIDLFLGLLDPLEGTIFYNDNNVKDNYSDYLSKIAYIPQQVFMSDDTLMSNVALGTNINKIDIKKVNYAIEKSSLLGLVKNLPQGLNTIIGERGMKLSGGEKQRIALARSFYYDRSILIMDESTSALDNNTEQEIINQIKLLKREKTIIIISHRHTTLKHCDYIYKIKDGGISNLGNYNSIIAGA